MDSCKCWLSLEWLSQAEPNGCKMEEGGGLERKGWNEWGG